MSESAGVAITTVFSILVLVDILGNTLVCLIIWRYRDMRSPINYLLVSLAVADIMYATFNIPGIYFKLTLSRHPDGMTGTLLCKLITGGNLAWVGAASSLGTFVAIAIERYYAIMYPFGNKWELNETKLKVIIAACWVFALIFCLPEFLVMDVVKTASGNLCGFQFPEEWMSKAYSVAWLVVVDSSLLLMVGLYSRTVYTLWFKGNDGVIHLNHQQRGVIRLRKRVTFMVVTVTAIFAICWCTCTTVYVLEYAAAQNIGHEALAIVNTMVLFNSAVNPFVYALLSTQFREKMKRMVCCTCSSASRVNPLTAAHGIQLVESTTHPTNTGGTSSTE